MFVDSVHYDRFVREFVSRTESKHFYWQRDNKDKVISKPTHFYTEEAEEYFLTLENKDKIKMFSGNTNSAMAPIYTKMVDYRAKFSVLLHILHGEESEEVGIKYVKMAQELYLPEDSLCINLIIECFGNHFDGHIFTCRIFRIF